MNLREIVAKLLSSLVPNEARFLLQLSQDRMASGRIFRVASKRLLLLATTTPALSLSSIMFKNGPLSSRELTLTRLIQFC